VRKSSWLKGWSVPVDRLASAASGGRVVPVQPGPARTPRVTVVIPCFNYGHYLPACVGAVLEQPGVDVDVVIVDDASTDDSGAAAERLADASARVRVVRHSRNAGHIATYNDGLAEAQGDYVVLLSADDLLTPGSLERATSLLEAHPSVGLVYGHAARFSDAPPATARTRPTAWLTWAGGDWAAERFRRGRNCIFSPEVVMRTSVQREIGGYRAELPHTGDLEMWLRAAAVADVGYVCGVDQAWYRMHASNMHATVFDSGKLEGMTRDMGERLRAFEYAAADPSVRPDVSDRLLRKAHRALAVEALTLATRSFYWGIADSWPVDELIAFACGIYPEATRLPHGRVLSVNRRIGTGWQQRNPLSLAHEVTLRARQASREWQWARAGL
jgi:glycosyltransferase involved in cell wall biosynthesis